MHCVFYICLDNNTRVCLMTTDDEDENNYINASRITVSNLTITSLLGVHISCRDTNVIHCLLQLNFQ